MFKKPLRIVLVSLASRQSSTAQNNASQSNLNSASSACDKNISGANAVDASLATRSCQLIAMTGEGKASRSVLWIKNLRLKPISDSDPLPHNKKRNATLRDPHVTLGLEGCRQRPCLGLRPSLPLPQVRHAEALTSQAKV